MENNTEIGKLLKSKLSNLDKSPNDIVWQNIEETLHKKRKKRYVMILFFSLLGIGLGSSLFMIYHFSNKQDQFNPNTLQKSNIKTVINSSYTEGDSAIINFSKATTPKNKHDDNTNNEKSLDDFKNSVITANQTKSPNKNNNSKKNVVLNSKSSRSKKGFKTNSSIAINSNTKTANENLHIEESDFRNSSNFTDLSQTNSKILNPIETDSIADVLVENKTIEEENNTNEKVKELVKSDTDSISKKGFGNLSITVYYGPSYFNTFSDQSLLNNAFNGIETQSKVSSTYGFYIKTTKEIHNFSLGFSITNNRIENKLESNKNFPSFNDIDLNSDLNANEINNILNNSNNNKLNQEFSYYNLNFNYYRKLLQLNKLKIEAITGVSFNYLDNNKLLLSTDLNSKRNIGSASNFMKANATFNTGLGFDYSISKKFSITINPMFNFYLTPVNTNRSTNPYNISIQPGISYKF
jgi:hypothetical protein